jgi:hypothetical protein
MGALSGTAITQVILPFAAEMAVVVQMPISAG